MNIIFENALYYTFSSISQTLGGAIALLAAFILYRIQLIRGEMDAHFEKFQLFVNRSTSLSLEQLLEMEKLYQDEDFEGLEKFLGGIPFSQFNENNRTRGKLLAKEMEKILIHKKLIMKRFNNSLLLTLNLIFISIVFIVLTPVMFKNLFIVILFFGIGVGSLGYCLFGYYQLIRGALSMNETFNFKNMLIDLRILIKTKWKKVFEKKKKLL